MMYGKTFRYGERDRNRFITNGKLDMELKIWYGNEYNERGEEQLTEYPDYFHQKKGYMLNFNFNKNKQTGIKSIKLDGRTIV